MKEALKLALESMKRIDAWLIQRGYTGLMPQEKEVITAIKAALAQPEHEFVAWKLMPRDATDSMLKAMDECSTEGYDERLYAGHAASVYMAAWDEAPTLAQPEQEPVAYLCENAIGHKYFRWKKPSSTYKPIALYATPPQRKPLTRGQIREIEVDVSLNPSFDYITPAEQLCRAIEAAHNIKE